MLARVIPPAVGAFLVVAVLVLVHSPVAAKADPLGNLGRGVLVLQLAGIPQGEPAVITLTGPRQTPGGRPLRRRLDLRSARTTVRLSAGRYRVAVQKATIQHTHETIRSGAIASPLHRRLRVSVRANGHAKLVIRYGTIINPGVRDVSDDVVRVLGVPSSPSAVVLRTGIKVSPGQILSAHPSAALPLGLLARAVSVSGGSNQQIVLQAASIYAVAPNFSFDIPVTVSEGAAESKVIKCGEDGVGAVPSVHLSDFRVSGGWSTTHLGPFDVKTGATAELHFRAAAGVNVHASSGFSCELQLPSVGFQGMAGPIPVYGGIRPGAKVDVGGSASMNAEGSTEVTVGVKAGGVPPQATPIFGFSAPSFKFESSVFAGVKAGVSLGAELGVGAIDAANLHVDLTNSLDFTAAPGVCSWDLELGAFSATGEVGPLSISTPSTPALHKNLWHRACGSPPAPTAPAPPTPIPTPTPPVAPPLPLTRAVMSWNTDADIDLYAWDESGDLLYFGEREGIPGAELVEDVIPDEGETTHAPEVFRETADPDRSYTFGICDFNRSGESVTLTVVDPGGATRTLSEFLEEEGDGVVVTTSPLGLGFQPQPGWCRSVRD